MLELRSLARRYGDVQALDGCSFSVEAGQVFGFVGANGAGKTTAMRIVMGIDRPDSGEVRWRGEPITREDRKSFGYMPEERGLYPKMTSARQLAYLARLHDIDRAEADRGARQWLDRLGLADRADDPIEKLSLGNQQRVQLAAALVHDPQALVLDEPFSGLDPVATDTMAGLLLDRAAAGVPVLFSSHQLELIERLCDSVAIIDAGRVVATGAVDELRTAGRKRVLRVGVEGAADDWAKGLAGVQSVSGSDSAFDLVLDSDADEQVVLDAARAAGRVVHFAFAVPTLAQLYRETLEANGEGER